MGSGSSSQHTVTRDITVDTVSGELSSSAEEATPPHSTTVPVSIARVTPNKPEVTNEAHTPVNGFGAPTSDLVNDLLGAPVRDLGISNSDQDSFSGSCSIHIDKPSGTDFDDDDSDTGSIDKDIDSVLKDTHDVSKDSMVPVSSRLEKIMDKSPPGENEHSSPRQVSPRTGAEPDTLPVGSTDTRESSAASKSSRTDSLRTSSDISEHRYGDSYIQLLEKQTVYDRNPGEWIIPKKPIEGFDPEKFMAANKRASQFNFEQNQKNQDKENDTVTLDHQIINRNTRSKRITYDNSEEDLLAEIENEFS